jgi:hypothetical protein
MAIFRGPIKRRTIPERWNLNIAGHRTAKELVNRDTTGKFRQKDKPDPPKVREVISRGEKKGWW